MTFYEETVLNKLKQETDSGLTDRSVEINMLEHAVRMKRAVCKYFVQSL